MNFIKVGRMKGTRIGAKEILREVLIENTLGVGKVGLAREEVIEELREFSWS